MAERDLTIKLRDGRTLAFTEHGDLSGKPVFFIHGNPSSRLMRHPDEGIVEELGARVITPDRPGYGRSDFQPNRKILDMPNDIVQLADALQIDKFAVFGVSAGSPYVAACAYKLSRRITSAAIVSGVAPMNRKGAYDGMHKAWRTAFQSSRHLPGWLLRGPLWAQSASANHSPDQALTNFGSMLSTADRKKLRSPEIQARVMKSRAESTRQGHKGWVVEAKLVVSPWGFRLDKIKTPMHLWYWEGDKAIPLQMGQYLASQIPKNQTHFFKRGGHLSIYDKWGEIIELLITKGQDERAAQSFSFSRSAPQAGELIYNDELVKVWHKPISTDKRTIVPGLLVLDLQRSVASLDELSDQDSQRVEKTVFRLSQAVQAATKADHIHQVIREKNDRPPQIHLVPRYPGTPFKYWGRRASQWPQAPQATAEAVADLCEQIRFSL